MSSNHNLLIVDDYQVYRNGLVLALKDFPDVKVVGEASTGQDCLKIIQKTPVDIILLDIRMPVMNGIETAKKVLQKKPRTKIVAMIDFIQEENLDNIFDAGFSGVILKNIDKDGLKHALQSVINGKTFYSPELIGVLTGGKRSGSSSNHITKREEQILQFVAKGKTNQQIANHLKVSLRTITNHRANMHKKFEVKNTVQLLSWGLKNKILPGI